VIPILVPTAIGRHFVRRARLVAKYEACCGDADLHEREVVRSAPQVPEWLRIGLQTNVHRGGNLPCSVVNVRREDEVLGREGRVGSGKNADDVVGCQLGFLELEAQRERSLQWKARDRLSRSGEVEQLLT
jgi:hypothetical protein